VLINEHDTAKGRCGCYGAQRDGDVGRESYTTGASSFFGGPVSSLRAETHSSSCRCVLGLLVFVLRCGTSSSALCHGSCYRELEGRLRFRCKTSASAHFCRVSLLREVAVRPPYSGGVQSDDGCPRVMRVDVIVRRAKTDVPFLEPKIR
jgi:hypothetical protein